MGSRLRLYRIVGLVLGSTSLIIKESFLLRQNQLIRSLISKSPPCSFYQRGLACNPKLSSGESVSPIHPAGGIPGPHPVRRVERPRPVPELRSRTLRLSRLPCVVDLQYGLHLLPLEGTSFDFKYKLDRVEEKSNSGSTRPWYKNKC